MNKYKNRILSLFLALVIFLGYIPNYVKAGVDTEGNNVNWEVEKQKDSDAWPLAPKNKLTRVSSISEPIRNPDIKYEGTYINGEGRTVIRLTYNVRLTASTAVWNNLALKFQDDFYNAVDWYHQGTGLREPGFSNHTSDANTNKIMPFTDSNKAIVGSNLVKIANISDYDGNSWNYSGPMEFVLKNGITVENLKGKDHLIQARLFDGDYERIYTNATADSEVAPYSTYTISTIIPFLQDYQKHINPDLFLTDNAGANTHPIFSATTYAIYNPIEGYIDVHHKFMNNSATREESGNGEDKSAVGFRQVLDSQFVALLKEDPVTQKVAVVGQADKSGKLYDKTMSDPNKTISLTRNDFETKDGITYLQIGSSKWNQALSTIKTKIVNNFNQQVIDNIDNLGNTGTSTIVRYYVDKEKVSKLIKGKGLKAFPFYSAVIRQDPVGTIEYEYTTDKEIKLTKGQEVNFVTSQEQKNYYRQLVIGENQYSMKFQDTIEAAKGVKNVNTQNKWTVPFDMLIQKGTKIVYKTPTTKGQIANGQSVEITGLGTSPITAKAKSIVHTERAFRLGDALTGGGLAQTVYKPVVNEIFTDSKKITGFSRYSLTEVNIFDDYLKNQNSQDISATENSQKVIVDGVEHDGYKFDTSVPNPAGDKQLLQYSNFNLPKLEKDAMISIANKDIISQSLVSNPVFEKVQVKVTFDLNGGKANLTVKSFEGFNENSPYKDFDYKLQRANETAPINRIAPLNTKYRHEADYKESGFVGINVSNLDHNGKELVGDAKKLRDFVNKSEIIAPKGTNNSELEFLGWTTKKIEGDATEIFEKLEEAKTVENVNDVNKNYIFTESTPFNKQITVYAAYGKNRTDAEKVEALGGLSPEAIKVWVKDEIDWKKGVKAKDESKAEEMKALLQNAEITDKTQPARTSEKAGDFEGTLLVKFADNSEIEVSKQILYVKNHKITDKNDTNLPEDAIEVKFAKGEGIASIGEKSLRVKPNTKLEAEDFPEAKIQDGYKEPVSWTPENKVVTETNKEFTAISIKKTDAEKYVPVGKEQTVKQDEVPQAKDSIGNKEELPQYTNYEFVDENGQTTTPDTSTVGEKPVKVKVNYPDGSSEIVETTIKVVPKDKIIERDDDSQPIPEGYARVTLVNDPVSVKDYNKIYDVITDGTIRYSDLLNVAPSPEANQDYKEPIVWKSGDVELALYLVPTQGTITAYATPKDSTKYTPTPVQQTVKQDEVPQAKDSIGNKEELPQDTNYEFVDDNGQKTTPDTSTVGEKPVKVKVNYPDGSSEIVETTIKVVPKDKIIERDDDSQPIPEGYFRVTLDEDSSVVYPEGAKKIYDVKKGENIRFADIYNRANVTPAEKHKEPIKWNLENTPVLAEGIIENSLQAGSDRLSLIPKATKVDSEVYTPAPVQQTVKQDEVPQAKDSIGNKEELPNGTSYEFVDDNGQTTTPDTSTVGEKPVKVKVNYPDGSSEIVETTIKVVSKDEVGAIVPIEEGPKDDEGNPIPPTSNHVLAELKSGANGSLVRKDNVAGQPEKETKFWVDKTKNVTFQDLVDRVETKAAENYEFDKWTKENDTNSINPNTKITEALVAVANFKQIEVEKPSIIPVDDENNPIPEGYVRVKIIEGEGVTITGTKIFDVKKSAHVFKEIIDLVELNITISEGYKNDKSKLIYNVDKASRIVENTEVVVKAEKADNNLYEPVGKEQSVIQGEQPIAKNSIGNTEDLPNGTSYEYENPVNTNEIGKQDATVIVTYPDGTKDKVNVVIKVLPKDNIIPVPDESKPTPEGYARVYLKNDPNTVESIYKVYDVKIGVVTSQELIDASQVVPQAKENYREPIVWKLNPTGARSVSIEDPAHKLEANDTLVAFASPKDALIYNPIGKNQTVEHGQTPKAEDSIANKDELPADTNYRFKEDIDTNTPGEKDATVIVEYPDGSSEEVKVKITVKEKTPEPQPQPEPNPEPEPTPEPTPQPEPVPEKSKEPKVNKVTEGDDKIIGKGEKDSEIIVELPDGTKLVGKVDENGDWTIKVPSDKTLKTDENIKVVQKEKDKENSNPIVVVVNKKETPIPEPKTKDADKYEPKGKDLIVNIGDKVDPKDTIENLKDLPKGTTSIFNTPFDTNKAGKNVVVVDVVYPDGSKDQITVNITVKEKLAPKPTTKKPVKPVKASVKPATKNPKTGDAGIISLAVLLMISTSVLLVLSKKKRYND